MSALLPTLALDSSPFLRAHFAYHQICWIEAEDPIHAQGRQVCALAEKSIRIGWTYCDGFKNVRKRLRFKKRDYLFVTKDLPSALEYMVRVYDFAEVFNLTHTIISHGEEFLKVPRLDERARKRGFTDEIKIGVIKFDNGSRIIAFSSNPQAMAVYGGDVGLDEFARHPNAQLLWETAQGRVALANDIAVWSAHDGEDTLFYQFALQARAACSSSTSSAARLESPLSETLLAAPKPDEGGSNLAIGSLAIGYSGAPIPLTNSLTHPLTNSSSRSPDSRPLASIRGSTSSPIENQKSKIKNRNTNSSPWNLYFRVTMPDALELGFLDHINRARGTNLQPDQFLADCKSRAGLPEIYEQSYLCNPVTPAAGIVDWSVIERCRHDYQIERLHLDHTAIQLDFGSPIPHTQIPREQKITAFLHSRFPRLFGRPLSSTGGEGQGEEASSRIRTLNSQLPNSQLRLGFDIAASGTGDLACIYIDSVGSAGGSPSPGGRSGSDGEGRGEGELRSGTSAFSLQPSAFATLIALLTCRTDDWHFLKTALFTFLRDLPNLQGAGDESGLGKQICWEAANHFGQTKFTPVNFRSKKSELGFLLMNQLSSAQKRFPKDHPDIAADFFALRKSYTGSHWLFTESKNPYNTASHCDIAWAGALASHAHTLKRSTAWAMVG